MRKQEWIAALVCVATVSGCSEIIKTVRPKRTGSFALPDVKGMTVSEAKTALAMDGVTGTIDVRDNICGTEDPTPVGHVCYQSPGAGQMVYGDLPVQLGVAVPKDHGGKGKDAWILMPDVRGKSVKEARAILGKAGMKDLVVTQDTMCQDGPDVVCETSPPTGTHAYLHVQNQLYVGEPKAKPPQDPKPEKKPDKDKQPDKDKKPDDASKSIF